MHCNLNESYIYVGYKDPVCARDKCPNAKEKESGAMKAITAHGLYGECMEMERNDCIKQINFEQLSEWCASVAAVAVPATVTSPLWHIHTVCIRQGKIVTSEHYVRARTR